MIEYWLKVKFNKISVVWLAAVSLVLVAAFLGSGGGAVVVGLVAFSAAAAAGPVRAWGGHFCAQWFPVDYQR